MSDVVGELDELRTSLGEVDALATVAVPWFDKADWHDADPLHVERMASLLGLISKSATGAMAAFHRLHASVADAQPLPAGVQWDHRDGTASAPGDAR